MRITHLGHACLLVEVAGARLLIDPGTFSSGWEELGGLDAVLVTHAHPDHVDTQKVPALLEGNDGVRVRTEPELAASLRDAGIDAEGAVDLAALHPGDVLDVAGARVRAVGGEHAVIHPDMPLIGNIGLVVSAPGEPVLFHPGDSYAVVPEGVDVLALPVNAPWAQLAMTVDFLRAVHPAHAVPVHDALLSPLGRASYLRGARSLVPGDIELHDTGGSGVVEL